MDEIRTDRLTLREWTAVLRAQETRQALETDLVRLLTGPVTHHLPSSMRPDDVGAWIDARRSEADVFLILTRDEELIGLILLAPGLPRAGTPEAHIGYLLAEDHWGKGYATEALAGVIAAISSDAGVRLLAGVERGNTASVRVLAKLGFVKLPGTGGESDDQFRLDLV